MKKNKIFIALLLLVTMLLGIGNVNAENGISSSPSDTQHSNTSGSIGSSVVTSGISSVLSSANPNTYYISARTNSKNVTAADSGVKIDKTIPSEYSFALGNTYESTDHATDSKYKQLTAAEIEHWDTDSKTFLSGGKSYHAKVTSNDSAKGFWTKYNKVGKYKGQDVDVKLTVVDYAFKSYTNPDLASTGRIPFIGFYNEKQTATMPGEENHRLGIQVGYIDWVRIKYEFFKSGTTEKINGIKGYTTYWDIDYKQGIQFLDKNKELYANNKTLTKITKIDNTPYVFDEKYTLGSDNTNNVYYGYNVHGVITEAFNTENDNSMERVFTFVRTTNSDATECQGEYKGQCYAIGGIWNSAIVNTSKKDYATDTPAGAEHSAVKVGDKIKYAIQYTNGDPDNTAQVTITDTLSKGLSYNNDAKVGNTDLALESGYPKQNADGTTTLMWKTSLAKASTATLTYSVTVTKTYEKNKVNNGATVTIGDHEYKLDQLVNPIPTKDYASDTPAGARGAEVKKGDHIKYSIKYANALSESQKVTITDTISKGIKYDKGSAKINGQALEPVKTTTNKDGSTTLVWEKTVNANANEELTYTVEVVGGVKQVNNHASMVYEHDGKTIFLNELKNPLKETLIDVVKIPDTASTIAITGIVAGVALLSYGGYTLYKRYKKA